MPRGLRRIYDRPHLHYITCSCYRRAPLLATAKARDKFLAIFEKVRRKLRFLVIGFVVMPEHFHLLISKPEIGDPSAVMHSLKTKLAHELLPKKKRKTKSQGKLWTDEEPARHFCQKRFYDFNVYSEKKRIEKLRYMHRNPVKRGLVNRADLWKWSSYRYYAYGEEGVVKIQRVGEPAGEAMPEKSKPAKAEGAWSPTLF